MTTANVLYDARLLGLAKVLWLQIWDRQDGERGTDGSSEVRTTADRLVAMNRESISTVRERLKELEQAGMITRHQDRTERGHMAGPAYFVAHVPPDVARYRAERSAAAATG